MFLLDLSAGERLQSAENLFSKGMEIFTREGDYKRALPYFERAIKLDRRFAEAWYYSGNCLAQLHEYQSAIKAYMEAIKVKPHYAEAHYNLGLAYSQIGGYEEKN
jgi:tetratricopeptide (TPR) repeat protein